MILCCALSKSVSNAFVSPWRTLIIKPPPSDPQAGREEGSKVRLRRRHSPSQVEEEGRQAGIDVALLIDDPWDERLRRAEGFVAVI